MRNNNNCIYDIFSWMGIVYKYTGAIPLPQAYENGTGQYLSNFVLPIFVFISTCYGLFEIIFLGLPKTFEKNLTDIILGLAWYLFIAGQVLFPLICQLRMSRRMVDYLKMHRKINRLLEARKQNLTRFVKKTVVVIFLIYYPSNIGFFFARASKNHKSHMLLEYCSLFNTLLYTFHYLSLPQYVYIVFQRVLREAFDQLLIEIRREKNTGTENLSPEERIKDVRQFAKMYCCLCQMCKMLDDMVSPLIVFRLIYCYVQMVYYCTFIVLSINEVNRQVVIFGIGMASVALILLPNFAQRTKNAASKVVPEIFSYFDCKEIIKEIEIFGPQSLQFKVSFSASGFVNLDRALILNLIQSITTQWVVFYKIQCNIN